MKALESSLGTKSLNERPTGNDLFPIRLFFPSLTNLCLSLKNILHTIACCLHQVLGNGQILNGPMQSPFFVSLSMASKAIFSSSGVNFPEKFLRKCPAPLYPDLKPSLRDFKTSVLMEETPSETIPQLDILTFVCSPLKP